MKLLVSPIRLQPGLSQKAMDRMGSEVEAPRSWPKQHKWRFHQLPCILRRYLVNHERDRERVVRQAQNEAARARQQLAENQKTPEASDGKAREAVRAH